ncbi:1-acyl-sn-glycerol-3-phosphate acyltransferase [Branchiibius sp. NY16-3462-2]|uniref:lysophospholipid acyltransferase family protein n=1 Tax=Branchiibius sp. NY16-3462-2 TaxID=1807500 RepID=UPI0007997E8F|nr:lysophospholipid acyltransferase family protein [Branchiibius sp. NY16-3462-2]KYH44433.1 glycerol acyltransferase [Branchiibius sp. NY16-3462-2]
MEPFYGSIIRIAQGAFVAQGLKVTRIGSENIPRKGGAVIALNHIGYMDFALAGYPALDQHRMIRFMAKKEVFDHKVSGPLMRGMKHIPVDRSAGIGAYQAAVQALKDGELIGVFPESTVSRSFELRGFKTGAVRMAAEAGVPVLPLIVWGSQRIWTKGHPKRLGRTNIPVTVRVGEPIWISPDADAEVATKDLHAVMETILHEVQEAYEPLTGDDLVFLPARLGGKAPTLEAAAAIEDAELAQKKAALAARRAQKDS